MARAVLRPTRSQYAAARAVTAWYLNTYYETPEDVGVPWMFCREDRVGHFAVDADALAAGDGAALFRLLVAMTMFQRRSDLQIMRVLRGISRGDAEEMTEPVSLLQLVDSVECPHIKALASLKEQCDLSKDSVTKRGMCTARAGTACHLKRHTELLRRYGHFGKVPTSAALTLRAHEVSSLAELKGRIWGEIDNPTERARALEQAISRSWRVSEKISAMFLSAVTNRALSGRLAPWSEGVDTAHFVVIDSNVDLFLRAISYSGPMTYRARREFIQALALRVRLDKHRPDLGRFNPRLVQQALYMFMSESNRRASARDCSHLAPVSCGECPRALSRYCPRRKSPKLGGSYA